MMILCPCNPDEEPTTPLATLPPLSAAAWASPGLTDTPPPRSCSTAGGRTPARPPSPPRKAGRGGRRHLSSETLAVLEAAKVPVHPAGYVAHWLARRRLTCEDSLALGRCTVDLYDDVAVKRRACPVDCPRLLADMVRDKPYLESAEKLGFTPPVLMYVAEHDDEAGELELVLVQARAAPLAPHSRCEDTLTLPEEVDEKSLVLGLLELVRAVAEEGLVHGDVRPSNVCLYEGRVVLIDWECAVRPLRGETLLDIGAPRLHFNPKDWRDVDAFAALSLCLLLAQPGTSAYDLLEPAAPRATRNYYTLLALL